MKKQLKKLTLNKETLRDLTTHNGGAVKGGTTVPYDACSVWCSYNCAPTYFCSFNCATAGCATVNCATGGCHGKTYNKKCLR